MYFLNLGVKGLNWSCISPGSADGLPPHAGEGVEYGRAAGLHRPGGPRPAGLHRSESQC